MTVFVDASALVAIIAREPEADSLTARLDRDEHLRTSAIAIWETSIGLARIYALEPAAALILVRRFPHDTGIAVEPIDARFAFD